VSTTSRLPNGWTVTRYWAFGAFHYEISDGISFDAEDIAELAVFAGYTVTKPGTAVTGGSVSESDHAPEFRSVEEFERDAAAPPDLTKGGGLGRSERSGLEGTAAASDVHERDHGSGAEQEEQGRGFHSSSVPQAPTLTKGGGSYDRRHPFEECADDDLCNVCRGLWFDPIHGGEPPTVTKAGGARTSCACGVLAAHCLVCSVHVAHCNRAASETAGLAPLFCWAMR
jgi:hypothetical protein